MPQLPDANGHRHPALRYLAGIEEPERQRGAMIFARFGVQLFVAAMVAPVAPPSVALTCWAVYCAGRGTRLWWRQRRAVNERVAVGPVELAATQLPPSYPGRHAAWVTDQPESCVRDSAQLRQTGTVA